MSNSCSLSNLWLYRSLSSLYYLSVQAGLLPEFNLLELFLILDLLNFMLFFNLLLQVYLIVWILIVPKDAYFLALLFTYKLQGCNFILKVLQLIGLGFKILIQYQDWSHVQGVYSILYLLPYVFFTYVSIAVYLEYVGIICIYWVDCVVVV